ncbi:hypothetical protein [Enterococcus faecalis]|jgi:hypothetical protein|uniref:hypothetical protein n=1 Tax=Enterococcus TaxID=1350 RepID=UPI000B3CE7F2|nr:hypothetical protein [Enterococcus faecalis]ARV05020.1 hypothetical protein A6B47_14035 [Enterococcus faecalis]MBG9437189.1 hypothetical protein [Enterococcus faecalis]MBG9439948.1 hypothetical protein [Enterococcus faecalis]MBG9442745.1 hypothetical protein [Enterococcus faecalis]MDL4860295.1 hypothetical protein [Enterococcus faecalis]
MGQEQKEFNTELFHEFLLRLVTDYQKGEMTEFKKGAVSALMQVEEQFQRSLEEPENQEV